MDPEATDPNLLLLSLDLSDSEPEEAAAPAVNGETAHNNNNDNRSTQTTSECQPTRADRTALSEAAFQALKRSYHPKVENGNIHETITLPPFSSASSPQTTNTNTTTAPLPKPEAQALLHAAEELYFFRRYADAAAFLRRVLGEDEDAGPDADPDAGPDASAGPAGEGRDAGAGADEDGDADGDDGKGGDGEDGKGGSRGGGGKEERRSSRPQGVGVMVDGETRRLLRL
ncbi:b96b99dc-7258-460d-881a-4dee18790a95 [Thermothielavioides terrestris]|uniref:B96b99dc-7258-460d-881a-4dee18790a95 n=1 Tax=Thermothielavioides terrestris TaxID=2587410 RepID=A0A446BEP7_9PEZI|nr:b96b99dc-7258-460d-881a-4dee18790a95 [Thermothielavioides terrestris]